MDIRFTHSPRQDGYSKYASAPLDDLQRSPLIHSLPCLSASASRIELRIG